MEKLKLNDGNEMPTVGIGTFNGARCGRRSSKKCFKKWI